MTMNIIQNAINEAFNDFSRPSWDKDKKQHKPYTTEDQWRDETEIFMNGLRTGDFIEFGNRSIGVEWRAGGNSNDPRFIVFEFGDARLRDDHFYIQHSPRLSDDQLKDIRDVMVRMGMVTKEEFDMEYGLNIQDYYESVVRRITKKVIDEAMYKKLPGEGEDFPKYLGRRPKNIKARINRIYRICDAYGLSTQKFHDEAWAAIGYYKRAIESLGYEVEIWVKNGGYCDYDPQDHMPRSKQYEIRITADDGMVIEGYIKCMAAGSVKDPFDAYDTCMVLWNKPKRSYNESIKKSDLRRMIQESLKQRINEWDRDDPDEGPEDHVYYESANNQFDGIYDLDTEEIYNIDEGPEIEAATDPFGGIHRYVLFTAYANVNVESEPDSYWSPGYWECNITGYDIEVDDTIYKTTIDGSNGCAYYEEKDQLPEKFNGFSEEQTKQIEEYLENECDLDFWDVH